jgi:hypothetical protein
MAVTSAISDLFASFYELFASILGAAYSIVHTVIMAVVNFVTGILTLVGDVLSGFVEMAGGVGKFLASKLDSLPSSSFFLFLYHLAFFFSQPPKASRLYSHVVTIVTDNSTL